MNNYHIYEEIGKGKYSQVYKGRKKKSIEYSAVKSLEKSRRKKVLNEVKIFHNLNHPNILKFFNWYETRNHLWIIVEYCPGGDLLQLIEQDKHLPENTIKAFGRDLTAGLQYLHSQSIIYCDLKPSNVLINEYGILKLSDFGLARKIVDMINTNNADNNKRGTPFYMAPELFQEDGVHSFQSDIWAFGCILYELAIGKPPFVSQQFIELVNLIVKEDVKRVENFSDDFNDLLQKILQKDPLKRITWKELCNHHFWGKSLECLTTPPQPHFENWLKKNNMIPTEELQPKSPKLLQTQQIIKKDNPNLGLADTIQKQQQKQGKEINVTRLSLNVMKNLQKEDDNIGYNNEKQKEKDVQLINRDQEIDIGESEVEEEEQESCDNQDSEEYGSEEVNNLDNIKVESQLNSQRFKENGKENSVTKITSNNKQFREVQTPLTQILEDSNVVNTPGSIKPGEGNMTPVNKLKTVPLDQLFTHPTDNAVKPIIGNKEIEKLQDPVFQKENLPFQFIPAEEVINQIESHLIENHFENIYTSLITPANDKANILNYFETIVQHSNVSNRLINSQFMNLLLKQLVAHKAPTIKARIASIIGLLIRHATVIENELSQLGIHTVMIDVLKTEKNDKVRRRCISALGEYLFYGATQIDEDPGNVFWDLSPSSYQCLIKVIKNPNEDEIVKCYACKTIENITAQSVSTGTKFSNPEIAQIIINVFMTSKNENLKISTIVTLTHMTVLTSSLIDFVLDKFAPNLINIITESSQRIQQGFLTMINMYILNSGQMIKYFDDSREFVNCIVSLLESSNVVVRGKAILTILLFIKVKFKILILLSEGKFIVILDKLIKDQYKNVQQCLFHLLVQLEEIIPIILKIIADELKKMNKSVNDASTLNFNEYEDTLSYGHNNQQKLRGNLCYINVILQFLNSASLKQKIYNHNYLEIIFTFLDYCEVDSQLNSEIINETKQSLFMVYENIITNSKFLINNSDFFIKSILPKLCDKFLNNEQVDIRFNCLKLFIDVLGQLMSESHIYDEKKPYGKFINEFLLKNVISNIKNLLVEQDPIPFYALKLINLLVEKNNMFVSALKKYKLFGLFIDYYKIDHPRLTINTLKIISSITENKEITSDELIGFNLINKSVSILKEYIGQKQEWAFEVLLEININFFIKLSETLQTMKIIMPPIDQQMYQSMPQYEQIQNLLKSYDPIFDIYENIFYLIENPDYNVMEKSLKLINFMMIVYGQSKFKSKLMKQDQLLIISRCILQCESIIQVRIYCKLLSWGFQSSLLRIKIGEKRDVVEQALEKLFNYNDQRMNMHINEIKKYIS